VVECVEEFAPEFHTHSVAYLEVFEEPEIDVLKRILAKGIPTKIPKRIRL